MIQCYPNKQLYKIGTFLFLFSISLLYTKISAQTTIIADCVTGTANLTTLSTSSTPANSILTFHSSNTGSDANRIADVSALPPGTYYAAFYHTIDLCYTPRLAEIIVESRTCLNVSTECGTGLADLSTLSASNQPSGTQLTFHTSEIPTNVNRISPITAVAPGTYFAAFFDATLSCYSAEVFPVGVANTNCADHFCPDTVIDLESQFSATNIPSGLSVTYHTAYPVSASNQVADPSAVKSGNYFIAFYDATAGGCYSGEGYAASEVIVEISVCDADNDGVIDLIDIDEDNDGILDLTETGGNDPYGDEDGDGIRNFLDVSDDGNGGDGSTTDYIDANGDGIPDVYDTDADGVIDFHDLDSDNDGIADIVEAGGVDTDGDGRVDGVFADGDGDGFSNVFDSDDGGNALADLDTDADGLPNRIDIDADNDGIIDIIESQPSGTLISPSGTDSDGDGIDDNFDPDSGNALTTPENTDGEGNPDYTDTDSDNDGDLDILEGWDTDNDGIANTIPAGTDSDGDGLDDNFDSVIGPNNTTNVTDNGKSSNFYPNLDNTGTTERDWREILDSDNDGITDIYDLDDDNDGILDSEELDCTSGVADVITLNVGVSLVTNALGIYDGAAAQVLTNDVLTLDLTDTVPEGATIRLRMRRDNNNRVLVEGSVDNTTYTNGITYGNLTADVDMPDLSVFYFLNYEAGAGGVRFVRFTQEVGPTSIDAVSYAPQCPVVDTDGDGIEDHLDIDSDGDGIPDIVEAGGIDADRDGRVDGVFADGDGDGFSNVFDDDNGGSALADRDTDNDGVKDRLDLDSDNDGIADIVEAGGVDSNGDGRVDSNADADRDGYADTFDADNGGTALADADFDGDGLNNRLDIDADNDGIIDNVEGQTTIGFQAPLGTDTDRDGWDDRYDSDDGGTAITISNKDGLGEPDYLDTDSDDDGYPDWQEGFDDDEDGDALNDILARATAYETAAGNPNTYVNSDDLDSDGIPDWLEDNDSDGVPNFLDPDNAIYVDTDGDGLVNLYDTDNNGVASVLPDGDSDGEYDFRDVNNTITLPVTLLYFNAVKSGNSAVLTWKTLTEINNDYFIIERSEGGNAFEPVFQVRGNGNSNQEITYSVIDQNPPSGDNYYRLTQVDFDGRTERFDDMIRTVYFDNLTTGNIRFYPNPTDGTQLFLKLEDSDQFNEIQIEVSTSKGELVHSITLRTEEEIIETEYEILRGLKLAKGVYYLRLRSKELIKTFKFIVS